MLWSSDSVVSKTDNMFVSYDVFFIRREFAKNSLRQRKESDEPTTVPCKRVSNRYTEILK